MTTRTNLPTLVQTELVSNDANIFHFKRLEVSDSSRVSTAYINSVIVNNTSPNTGDVWFASAYSNSFTSSLLPSNGQFIFNNLLTNNVTSSASNTALYNWIRGFLYRSDTYSSWNMYLSGATSAYVVSKSTIASPPCLPAIANNPSISAALGSISAYGAITGVRVIVFNRSLYKNYIQPSSFRMLVNPTYSALIPGGLLLNNPNATDSSSGQFASLTGIAGLSGSLSAGVSGGSVLTSFTIAFRLKPFAGGPTTQSLLHRRVADTSSSALDWTAASPGTNNRIVMRPYYELNPLSAVATKTIGLGSSYTTSSASLTALITLVNKGGGILNWNASANNSLIFSLSGALTSGTLYGLTNTTSTTAVLTAYTTATGQQALTGIYGSTNFYITIYNSPATREQSPNLPITLTFSFVGNGFGTGVTLQ